MKVIGLKFFVALFFIHSLVNSQQVNHNSDLYSKFTPIYGYDMSTADETGIILSTDLFDNKYDCFGKCSNRQDCKMLSYKINTCKLFNTVRYSLTISTTGPFLFEKFSPDFSLINAYLTNHWPFNNNLNDIISGANLFGGSGNSFATDRLNQQLSAIYLNNQYLQVPSGIYFKTDFTVSVWVKTFRLANWDRIIDFGNAAASDNIVFAISNSIAPYAGVCNAGSCGSSASTLTIKIGKWHHIAFTLQSTNAKIYVDGKLGASFTLPAIRSITRSSNFVGRSNWLDSINVNTYFDDLKIFNKSLSQSEINMVLNSYY